MSRNKKPCTYCKKRRRKCIFDSNNNSDGCKLCMQMNVDCIPCDPVEECLPVRDGNKAVQQWQKEIKQLESDLQSMQHLVRNVDYYNNNYYKHINHEVDNGNINNFEWRLRVVNGCIRLDSRIRNIEELLIYHQATIRYLSPFQPFFQFDRIQFKNMPRSIPVVSTALIARYAKPPNTPRHTIMDYPEGFKTKNNSTLYNTTTLLKQTMDELITLYLDRYNQFVGLIHAPSFLKHYHTLEDPLSSPMVLAVCIDTIAYFYPRLKYSTEEKRQLAEFFYTRCRDLLLDMYDDPEYRLQAIISTTLLMQYLLEVLLEFAEARRLLTVAYLASHEVDLNKLSKVEYAIFQRHRVALEIYISQTDVILHDRYDCSIVNFTNVNIHEDDSPAVASYFAMYKAIFALIKTPYMANILEQLSVAIIHGKSFESNLDQILLFEHVLTSWWKELPQEFLICDQPFDLSTGLNAVERVTSSTQLAPFAVLHVITAIVQSVLLKPRFDNDDDSSEISGYNEDIINIIREKALSMTLCSIQLLVYMMKKHIEVDIEAIPIIPTNHHISRSGSLLESFVATLKHNPLSVYEKYPMPKLAMISDILYTCFSQLGST
ncbi:hypothetical protein INT45_005054 [Circinella minor]|uniref:Zn(2)-C6 fungal-type domain-containing protein n=1 Tax=Circinella minor TaxID=1195481 RepID=A0A8H7VRY3_9FUNG|nr:hypothetical protein INT45_005054 [Circinella minor]